MSPIVHLCNRNSPMPLVLLCGQPCSGKSTVAQLVAVHLRSLTLEVVVIDEDSLGLERSVAYKGKLTACDRKGPICNKDHLRLLFVQTQQARNRREGCLSLQYNENSEERE